MASGEAEPLQYTTTVLRVSIHCEGCKKKVKKVLHSIEGVYKVTVDAAQHKVIVTGSVDADALIRRLNKAGKQAALWPAAAAAVAPAVEAKKGPEEVAAAPPTDVAGCNKEDAVVDTAEAKQKDAAEDKGTDKQVVEEAEGTPVKKPEKDKGSSDNKKKPAEKGKGSSDINKKPAEKGKGSSDKKAEKGDAAVKVKDDGVEKQGREAADAKEKKSCSPDTAEAKEAEEASGGEEGGSAKMGSGKKKKNKQKDGAAATTEKPAPLKPAIPPPQPLGPPEQRSLAGFPPPYYAPQPVMSFNVAHPSSSVSYYAPTPAMPVHPVPPPPQVPYGYPQYPPMMMPPPPPAAMPEYMYGPPGMRSSPPRESYNNMFNEENANSCSLM